MEVEHSASGAGVCRRCGRGYNEGESERILAEEKSYKAEAAVLSALTVMVWAPFLARAWGGFSAVAEPLSHDVGLQWIPFRIFIGRALAEGVFPLWAEEIFAGFPFAAFSHGGVFYPPAYLLLLGSYARSANFFYPLHLSVAGWGLYFFCRRAGLGRAAGFLAAISYVFSGKPFYFIHFLPSVCSNVWFPWFLFSVHRLLEKGRLVDLIWAAVFLSLQILGGDVESTGYALLFSAPALYLLRPADAGGKKRLVPTAFFFALAFFFCALQFLPLLELSERFLRNQGVTFSYFSQRRLPPTILWALFLPAEGLKNHPEILLEGPYFYLGFFTFTMAGLAVSLPAAKSSRPLGLLTLLVFAWSFGSFSIMERLQFLLPFFDRFGSPEQAFFVGQVFLVVLAGQGFQRGLAEGQMSRRFWPPIAVLLLLALAGLLSGVRVMDLRGWVLMTAAFFLLAALSLLLPGLRRKFWGRRVLVGLVLVFQTLDLYIPAFRHLPRNHPSLFDYRPWLADLAETLRPANSRAIMVSRLGLRDPDLLYHAGLALNLDFIDGWITTPLRDYAELLARVDPRAAAFRENKLDHLGLNCELRDGRFIDAAGLPLLDLLSLRFVIDRGMPLKFSSPFYLAWLPPEYHRRSIPHGAAARLEQRQPPARSPWFDDLLAGPNETYRFRMFVNPGDVMTLTAAAFQEKQPTSATARLRIEVKTDNRTLTIFQEDLPVQNPDPRSAALNPLNLDLSPVWGKEVELSLMTSGPPEPGLYFWMVPAVINPKKPLRLLEMTTPGVLVYENREALPRAFLAHEVETIAEPQALLSRLAEASRHELSRRVFMSTKVERAKTAGGVLPLGREAVVLARRRPGEVVYQVNAVSPGVVFMSDQYYPGWQAWVEGEEERIYRADYCFRAVPVPAGVTTLRLAYVPAAFRIGLFITLTAWPSAAAFLLLPGWRGIRKRKTSLP